MSSVSSQRNLSMECCKMVAALAVVSLHVRYPGEFNSVASVLSQFANPVFFAITGYFNFRAKPEQIKRRFLHVVKLYFTAYLFHILLRCINIELNSGSTIAYLRAAIPDPDEIIWWLVYQQDSFLAQLWFLTSTGLCYLVLWIYTQYYEDREIHYQPLYYAGFILYTVNFLLKTVLPVSGTSVSFYAFRNGWFFGLPLFFFGMFLRENQIRIVRCFRLNTFRELMLIFIGQILCLLHLFSGVDGGMPLGNPLVVIGLMLFLAEHPQIPGLGQRGKILVQKFGPWSTGIYLFHVTVMGIYDSRLMEPMQQCLGSAEPWLRTYVIYFLSLFVAILWQSLTELLKAKRKKLPVQT